MLYDRLMVDMELVCDQCGGRLNTTYPLRLVSGDPQVPTKVRHICIACIGTSIASLETASATCPGCSGVLAIFQNLVVAIRDAGERDQRVMAIVVPPNKAPHIPGCEYGPNEIVRDTPHDMSDNAGNN